MKKLLFTLHLFILTTLAASAQLVRFSGTSEAFAAEMKTVMASANAPFATAAADKLATYWPGLTAEQQKVVIGIAQEMGRRGHKAPQFYQLLRLLEQQTSDPKPSTENLTSLLVVVQKMVAANPLKKAENTLEQLNEFLRTKLIYTSNFNKLYASGGQFAIRYLEKETPYFQANTTTAATSAADKSIFDSWDAPPSTDWAATASGEWVKKSVDLPLASDVVIDLKDVTLAFVTPSDSLVIANTTGGVLYGKGVFIGTGGTVSWRTQGMPDVQASLKNYFFELRNPRFTAADVTLSYPGRLTAPISGILEFKGGKRAAGVESTYPRFMSYDASADFKKPEIGLRYTGGFSLMGKRIVSSAVGNTYSTIEVKEEGQQHFKLVSDKFYLTDSLITADNASFVAYKGTDSISHPAVRVYYPIKDRYIRLNKLDNGGYKNTPYNDSYHQMEIQCDAMKWDFTTQRMDFYIVSGKGEVPVVFESFNYFNPRRVTDLSGLVGFNPLLVVANHARKTKRMDFTLDELATAVGRPVEMLKGGVLATAQMGLLTFNPFTKRYTISPKGKHYIQAFSGEKDFDDFAFSSFHKSTDSTANGSLDFNKMELKIRGTKEFVLSDSLGITLRPRNEQVDMKKNRKFSFDGDLIVKNYRFTGSEIEIDYDNFIVKLNKIEAIHFTPLAIYRGGGKLELGGQIKYDHPGVLYLNSATNKSGKASMAEYPRLVIDKGVKVYFDEETRGSRRYDRSVYFEVPSIDMDSLNTKDLEWAGTFHSGGIFTPFKEKLVVMPDTSIGFSHHVPGGRYAVFGGQSAIKFASPLQLTRRGLVAAGELNHLAATLTASHLGFTTSTLEGKGPGGKIIEQKGKGYFPNIAITDYSMLWKPKSDSLLVQTGEKPFQLYGTSTAFTGQLAVREAGVVGKGVLDREDSRTKSDRIVFEPNGFVSSPSLFNIKSADPKAKPVLSGQNVEVNFNVLTNIVNIAAVKQSFNDTLQASLEFPAAAYRTNTSTAVWGVQEKKVRMKGKVEETTFTATAPAQEGLKFNGSEAVYDIPGMTLNISGVPHIVSADARIIPDKGKVVIKPDGLMEQLLNAELMIDTLNSYHHLTNGNIRISSRTKFHGDATYQFVNVAGQKFPIKLGNFELRDLNEGETTRGKAPKPQLATIARATLTQKDSIFLSPRILYKGEMTMIAPQKNLYLDGAVMPALKKYPQFQLGGNWIAYQGSKSEDVAITVDEKLASNDVRLYSGLHLKADVTSSGFYPTFLSMKKLAEDENIFVAKGTLRRDEPTKSYRISTESVAANEMALSDATNVLQMAGAFNLLSGGAEKYVKTAGFGQIELDSSRYTFDLLLGLDFPLPTQVLQTMGAALIKANLDLGNSERAIEPENPLFLPKFVTLLGEREAQNYQKQLAKEHVPVFKAQPRLGGSIVVSKATLRYFPKNNGLFSYGKIGIANVGENDINAMMPGYIEILKNPIDGDQITLLLELAQDNWYYLSYRNGELAVVSSDNGLNDLVAAKEKGGKKEKDYALVPADVSDPAVFRRRFYSTYLGMKNPPKTPPKAEPAKKKAEEKEGF